MTTRKQLIGQIQRPGQRPESVRLTVSETFNGVPDPLFLEQFGGGPDKTGAENDAAFGAIVKKMENGVRRIQFGEGQYKFATSWPTNFGTGIQGVEIEGVGAHRQMATDAGTEIMFEAAEDDIFWQPINVHHCVIRKLRFVPSDDTVRRTLGISLRGCSGWLFEQVHFRDWSLGGLEFRTDTSLGCLYNTAINCSASNITKANAADADAYGLRVRDPDSGEATNQNVFINWNSGSCDTGVSQQDTPNETIFIGLEVGSCTTGVRVVGRGLYINGANIENCTDGISIPGGAANVRMVLDGVSLISNTTGILAASGATGVCYFTGGRVSGNSTDFNLATAFYLVPGEVTNTNTPSGATAYALPYHDAGGALLGYIPVYTSQW